jgi:iron-sulfur cluster assembly protein
MESEQQQASPIVELTESAVARVRQAIAADGRSGLALRLAVTKGGCSGYEYSIKFTDERPTGDLRYDVDGLEVLVDAESVPQLQGTVLDYSDGLYGAGLKFRNPNAAHSCGCGASFSTAAGAEAD